MRSPLRFLRRDTPDPPPAGPPAAAPGARDAAPAAARLTPHLGAPAVRAAVAPSPVLGQMLDVITAALAATGQYALEDGTLPPHEARLMAERWRRHVSSGIARPDDESRAPTSRSLALAERDWVGATQFLIERRRSEHEHVNRALCDFRETIWTLVQGLHALLEAEQAAGRQSLAAVERVQAAIAAPDTGTVRDAALAAVGELSGLLEGRARTRGTQVADLGTRVSRLDAALRDAYRGGGDDPLTGLGARPALEEALTHAASLRTLWGHRVCLTLVAVERLDAVCAAGGPVAADRVLLDAAAALARVFLRKGDTIFRADDSTFAVLLGATGAAEAIPLLERIPDAVEARLGAAAEATVDGDGADADTVGVTCTLTVGFAELGGDETAPAWLARAERTLAAELRRTAAA
jgi:GGDEF domain-containing protein